MTAYDSWLEKPYQDAYAEQEAIDEIVEGLMQTECNPQDASVFLEAINEGGCLNDDNVHKRLKEILAAGHSYADIGELVYDAVVGYCEANAIDRAESIIKIRRK
jgi:hypothetical protein